MYSALFKCLIGSVVFVCAALSAVGCSSQPAKDAVTPETAAASSGSSVLSVAKQTAAPQTVPTGSSKPAFLLAETVDAGRSYVNETLFLGDSNTARYMMYADETGQAFTTQANNIGVVSMGVQSISTLKCEQFKGSSQMYTIPDAVAMLKPRRIVICFGTNNLSGSSTDASNYITSYLKGLQAIRDAWPYADFIISAIPPLDQQRENTNLTMTQVDAYNEALLTMCKENGFYFLNSAEVLKDPETGWARKDYTLSDGVHLSKTAVTAYFSYFRTHACLTEDRRPQPLGTIPTPVGPPVNLINKDPIAVRGGSVKVPVEFVASNGGRLQGSVSQLVAKGGTASPVTAVADNGYVFSGWTASRGSGSSSESISFQVPSDADAGGVVLTAHFTAAEHEHDWYEIDGSRSAPGCLYGGSVRYSCTICGEVKENELPALGHDWNEGVWSEDGLKKIFTCKRDGCGVSKEELLATPSPSPLPTESPVPTETPAPTPTPELPPENTPAPTAPPETPAPHEHSYVLTASVPAQPGVPGSNTYSCTCGASYTESTPALPEETPVPAPDPVPPPAESVPDSTEPPLPEEPQPPQESAPEPPAEEPAVQEPPAE